MYSQAEFAPLSQASLKRLLKGHTVRVKHGTGLKLALSKMQMKKHLASKKKGQGGYNMTMDPYQSQMHGQGFFDDVGSAFKKMGDSFVENVAKPIGNEIVSVGKEAGREIVKEGKKRGRRVASQVIHEGIPYASEALGGIAGATLGGIATENPLGAEAGEVIGQRLGSYGGRKLANYVGKKTGLGLKHLPVMKPRLLGGTLLIDQPFTTRQAVNATGNFFKDPKGTIGFGSMPTIPNQYKGRPQMGGTLLIDQPFTARQAVNATGNFFKDPKGTIGFGMGRGRGGALLQAGY
jgi:hypothetical protein